MRGAHRVHTCCLLTTASVQYNSASRIYCSQVRLAAGLPICLWIAVVVATVTLPLPLLLPLLGISQQAGMICPPDK